MVGGSRVRVDSVGSGRGHFQGLRPRGKETPFRSLFDSVGSGRDVRGVLTRGGRVSLDDVPFIARVSRAQVAGQMTDPLARPLSVRHCVRDVKSRFLRRLGCDSFLGRTGGGVGYARSVVRRVGLGFRAIDGGDEMCEGADAKDFGPHARSACDAALRDPRGARAESPKVES